VVQGRGGWEPGIKEVWPARLERGYFDPGHHVEVVGKSILGSNAIVSTLHLTKTWSPLQLVFFTAGPFHNLRVDVRKGWIYYPCVKPLGLALHSPGPYAQ